MNGDRQDRFQHAGEDVLVSSADEKLTRRQMLGATTAVGVTATLAAASVSGATDPAIIADAASANDPQLASILDKLRVL